MCEHCPDLDDSLPESDDLDAIIAAPKKGEVTHAGIGSPTGHEEPCRKCRGSGRFTGYRGNDLGPCYTCKGKGKQTYKQPAHVRAANRVSAANRAATRELAHLEAFKLAHPDLWAWMDGNDFEFARAMVEAVKKYGHLTERQLAATQNCAAKLAAKKAERAEKQAAILDAAPTMDTSKIEEAFAVAASHLSRPFLLLTGFKITRAGSASRNPGALYVKTGQTYLGKIAGGKFVRGPACDDVLEARILKAAADPEAAAIAYGKETGSCSCCGRELTNKLSLELGIGPICRARFGWGG